MEKITMWKLSITSALGVVSAALGWFGWLVIAYAAAMVLDYITGTAAAYRNGEWSSKTAREGCWHKLGSIAAVLAALLFDGLVGVVVNHLPGISLPFSYTVLIAPVVLVWYIVTELGSMVENAVRMGAVVPAFLLRALAAAGHAVEQAGEELVPTEKEE